MYDVKDIAEYIINYSNEKDYDMTNLRLQKLLYFVQGHNIRTREKKLFDVDFEAWDFGPVVRDIYFEYSKHGGTYINATDNAIENKNKIDKADRDSIEFVVDKACHIPTFELVDISHEQSPWSNSYQKNVFNKIPNEEMLSFFTKNQTTFLEE